MLPENMVSYRFHLLDQFRIEQFEDGSYRSIALPPKRTHPVLFILLLDPRRHSRECLASHLFPDMVESLGRKRLRDLLYLLKRSLPDLDLVIQRQHIHLLPTSRWLDVEAFQKAATGVTIDDWLEATRLYKGDLYLGADQVVESSQRFYLLFTGALFKAADYYFRHHELSAALPLAQRLLQAELYDEKAVRLLMNIYHAQGKRSQALATYASFARRIKIEFDGRPEPATQELARAIQVVMPPPLVALSPTARSKSASLLHLAQTALDRPDRERFLAIMACLEKHSDTFTDHERAQYTLLQIDEALQFDEYRQAIQLLEQTEFAAKPDFLTRQAKVLFMQGNIEGGDIATKALLLANRDGNKKAELEALLVLTRTKSGLLGLAGEAQSSIEKCLVLARQLHQPKKISEALTIQAGIFLWQGQLVESERIFREALVVAQEHNLHDHSAFAFLGLADVQLETGRLSQALESCQKARQLWERIGRENYVIQTSLLQSELEADFGREQQAITLLRRAKEFHEQQGADFEHAIAQYHMAVTLSEYGEPRLDEARAEAEAALATFRYYKSLPWEASTLAVLGEIQWLDKAYKTVLATAQQLGLLYESLQEQLFRTDIAWLYCLAYLGLGDTAKALVWGKQLFHRIHCSVEDSTADRHYWAFALALEANQCQAEANGCFRSAAQIIIRKANSLASDEMRHVYFQSNIFRRWVMAAANDRGLL